MHFAVAMLRLVDRAAGAGTGGERIYSIEREVRTFEVRWRGARQAPAVGRSGAAKEIRWVIMRHSLTKSLSQKVKISIAIETS